MARLVFRASLGALALLFIVVTVVFACDPYGANAGAAGFLAPYPSGKGIKGQTDVQDASPGGGAAVVHPAQVLSATTNDFIGWGVYKGEGAPGCPDNFNNHWRIYADSIISGVYTCQANFGTVADNAANQTFQIDYEWCNIYSVFRWRLYWNGVLKGCIAMGGTTTDNISAGSEETPPSAPQQNLLVHYENMQYRKSTGGFVNWPIVGVCENDPPYWVDVDGVNIYWIRVR